MARDLIGRQDLERLALKEIRSFPGGEYVLGVGVEYRIVTEGHANWILLAYVNKGRRPAGMEAAIRRVQDQLQRRYDLRLD